MEIIIFFTTLVCSLLIGFVLSVLDLKGEKESSPNKKFNKFHRLLIQINSPFLKILVSLLCPAVAVLCWYEAIFISSPILHRIFMWAVCLCGAYFIIIFAYLLIQPAGLHERNLFSSFPKQWKQSFYGNLMIMALFIGISTFTIIYKGEFNFEQITYAAGSIMIFAWLIYILLKVGKFLAYILKKTYSFFKNIIKIYWNWVLSH